MATLEAKFVGKLAGKVALVTGASRGLGKGIAIMLAKAGATVYITGRILPNTSVSPGSVTQTAEEIRADGGHCIPVHCDHANDEQVKQLFEQIGKEQDGKLDILVNNAFAGVTFLMKHGGKPFFEQPIEGWDHVNNVGLRSNYICAHHAARMMVRRRQGLIVNISSYGGLRFLFGTVYGVGKEGNDRMAIDMAIELKKHNVASVSLWPGPVRTERIEEEMNSGKMNEKSKALFTYSEDPTFAGKAVVALASDENIMSKSGRVHIAAEVGSEYGFTDVGGDVPLSLRQCKFLLRHYYPTISSYFPSWLYIPKWMISMMGQKL